MQASISFVDISYKNMERFIPEVFPHFLLQFWVERVTLFYKFDIQYMQNKSINFLITIITIEAV